MVRHEGYPFDQYPDYQSYYSQINEGHFLRLGKGTEDIPTLWLLSVDTTVADLVLTTLDHFERKWLRSEHRGISVGETGYLVNNRLLPRFSFSAGQFLFYDQSFNLLDSLAISRYFSDAVAAGDDEWLCLTTATSSVGEDTLYLVRFSRNDGIISRHPLLIDRIFLKDDPRIYPITEGEYLVSYHLIDPEVSLSAHSKNLMRIDEDGNIISQMVIPSNYRRSGPVYATVDDQGNFYSCSQLWRTDSLEMVKVNPDGEIIYMISHTFDGGYRFELGDFALDANGEDMLLTLVYDFAESRVVEFDCATAELKTEHFLAERAFNYGRTLARYNSDGNIIVASPVVSEPDPIPIPEQAALEVSRINSSGEVELLGRLQAGIYGGFEPHDLLVLEEGRLAIVGQQSENLGLDDFGSILLIDYPAEYSGPPFEEDELSLQLGPNPVSSDLTLYWRQPSGPFTIDLFNELGQKLSEWSGNAMDYREFTIDVSFLPIGTYFVQLQTGDDRSVATFFKL